MNRHERNLRDRTALLKTRPLIAVWRSGFDSRDCPFDVSVSVTADSFSGTVTPRHPPPAGLVVLLAAVADPGGYYWLAGVNYDESYVECIAWPAGEDYRHKGVGRP